MQTSRALLSLAVMEEQYRSSGDIRSSLVPLFAPIAAARKGELFSPRQCVSDLLERYDIRIDEWAVGSLQEILVSYGILECQPLATGTVGLFYAVLPEPAPSIRLDEIEQALNQFSEYASRHMRGRDTPWDDDKLQAALLDRLVRMEFLHILSKPNNRETPSTLSLQRPKATDEMEPGEQSEQEQLDVLCASFLLDCERNNPDLFDLFAKVCAGALLTELVLDLQSPETSGDQLSELCVFLDGPIVLDLLNLSDDVHFAHAQQMSSEMTQLGATLAVLPHLLDEIAGAIRGPLDAIRNGQKPYGPLGRRLSIGERGLELYSRSVLNDLPKHVSDLGIEIFRPEQIPYAKGLAKFPKPLDQDLAGALPGESIETRLRDAKSVLDVLRLRGDEIIGSAISRSRYIFVSRNETLVKRCRDRLIRDRRLSSSVAPPAISDRQLAGILWILVGGAGETLTRTQLIANCMSAVAAKGDVVSRVYKFLSDLDPKKAAYFEALMTTDRGSQVLMAATLGDSRSVTADNVLEIYQEVERSAGERVAKEKDEKIAERDAELQRHKDLLASMEARMADAEERVAESKNARDGSHKAALQAAERISEIEERIGERDLALANACVSVGLAAGKRLRVCLLSGVFLLGLFLFVALELVKPGIGQAQLGTFANAFLVGFLAILGALVVGFSPGVIGAWVVNVRERAAKAEASRLGLAGLFEAYDIDWREGTATKRNRSLELNAGTKLA